jgi:hypothetical protein
MVRRAIRVVCVGTAALIVAGCGASTHHDSAKAHPVNGSDSSTSAQTASAPVTTTTSQRTSTSRVRSSTAKSPAAAKPSVGYCLTHAGLRDVTESSYQRWQGVVGDHPLSDANAFVFVVGPYSSAGAVRRAVPTIEKGEIAAAGGLYLLVGNPAGHVAAPIASAAACLRSIKSSRPKRSKAYKF